MIDNSFPLLPSLTRLHRLHFHLLWSRNETKGLMYVLQDRHLTIVLDVTTGSCYKEETRGGKKNISSSTTYFLFIAGKGKTAFKKVLLWLLELRNGCLPTS